MIPRLILLVSALSLSLLQLDHAAEGCDTRFDGFGVHLGALHHFNETNEQVIRAVMDKIYFELQLRHLRTSYEPYFSRTENEYDLHCDASDCYWAWETLLEVAAEPRYQSPAPTFIASIWSPPYYMKDPVLVRLRNEYEPQFHHYIRNITDLIQSRFNINIERISPVNEPENIFAPWDHCNMDPKQLCRMVQDFNDSLVSTCTENSYYWVTELYMNFKHPTLDIECASSCDVVSTHAYALNINANSPDFLLAYYDLVPYERGKNGGGGLMDGRRIWQTEVSSTYHDADKNQMGEGLDMATNIVNFVGTTCVERYYFWSAFTIGHSGESLIWGKLDADEESGFKLQFPKKYFIFNHFTNASIAAGAGVSGDSEVIVQRCDKNDFVRGGEPPLTTCLKFDERNLVFVNKEIFDVELNTDVIDCSMALCCTTAHFDNACDPSDHKSLLPPQSVCRCEGRGEGEITSTRTTTTTTSTATEKPSTTTDDSSGVSWKPQAYYFVMGALVSVITLLL